MAHEALVHLVRAAPALVVDLLRRSLQLGEPLHVVSRVTAAEVVDLHLAEYRADVVLLLGDPERPSEAFVIEVQGEADPQKWRSWPIYVAGARARLGCPVTLVVLATDPEVARWAARPIDLGRGRSVVHPLVLGPAEIPFVTDLDEARRSPELAVLSVAAHGHEAGAEYIALAALAATRDLDRDRGLLYPDFVFALLGKVARAALEKCMHIGKYEFQSDFARKFYKMGLDAGQAAGQTSGQAQLLLRLLNHRGFELSDRRVREVEACDDPAQLERWATRVLDARSLADVFGDEP